MKKINKLKTKKFYLSETALLISNALAEDVGSGDITSVRLIEAKTKAKAGIIVKENNVVVCGVDVLKEVFYQIDPKIIIKSYVKDGDFLRKKSKVCDVFGSARSILTAERTALNFLGRLSGISTRTYFLVKKIRSFKTKILDTRKTTPGLRVLEKYAVKIGGGINHRIGLYDHVLIKDNHLRFLMQKNRDDVFFRAVNSFRDTLPSGTKIEIEVKNQAELKKALNSNPDVIMLDNMNLAQTRLAVKTRDSLNKKIKLESSGNINDANLVSVARCGVDFISLGALTHSAKSVDFSLNFMNH